MVISDGGYRVETDVLSQDMSRLQRSCHRLIWLNPLLGSDSSEPLTRGMQAALPYIDDFLPVHNFNSLEALGRHLNQLGPRRVLGTAYRSPVAEEPEPIAPASAAGPMGRRPDPDHPPSFRHPLWGRER